MQTLIANNSSGNVYPVADPGFFFQGGGGAIPKNILRAFRELLF